MSIINAGTVSNAGGKVWTFTGSDLFDQGADAGDLLQIAGTNSYYHIEIQPTNNTSVTTVESYGGVALVSVDYQILTGFIGYRMTQIDPDMRDSFYAITRNFEIIADELTDLGASADKYQVITKKHIGVPVQGEYFGYQKFTNQVQIDKIIIASQDGSVTDTNLVLDLEIDGVLQGLNLTVLANTASKESAALSYSVPAGDVIRLVWVTATEPCGSNWDIDIHFHNTAPNIVHYDFNKMYFGEIYTGLVLGTAFKFPVDRSIIYLDYELDEAAAGADIELEVLLDGVSFGTPVTATIPQGSKTGTLALAQEEILSTETCSVSITQVGSTIAGSNLRITIQSINSV